MYSYKQQTKGLKNPKANLGALLMGYPKKEHPIYVI